MRQVFLEKDSVVVREVCQPVLDDYGIIVCVYYSCITSGAEVDTLIANRQERIVDNIPQKIKKMMEYIGQHGMRSSTLYVKNNVQGKTRPLGYSCSGRVVAIGKKIKTVKVGDWVACMGEQYAHHADIIYVPETHCVPLTHSSSLKYASLVAPGSLALQAVRRAQLSLGETVAVIGLDLFGQLTVQMVKNSGAIPYAIDIVQDRLKLAQLSGARAALNGSSETVAQQINLLTQYNGVDVTIITAQAVDQNLVAHAVQITRPRGKIVIAGSVEVMLSKEQIQKKEIDILFCSSLYDQSAFDQLHQNYPPWHVRWTQQRNMKTFVDCVEQGALSLQLLVDEIAIDDIAYAYSAVADKKKSAVIISYDPPENEISVLSQTNNIQLDAHKPQFMPAIPDKIGIGIIGLTADTVDTVLPIMAQTKGSRFVTFCDEDMTKAIALTNWYASTAGISSAQEVIKTDTIDMIVLGNNKNNSSLLLSALSQGKAVFLNGPLAHSLDELKEVSSFLLQHPEIPLCVNYYRSFSPFINHIKYALHKRVTPFMSSYRLNFNKVINSTDQSVTEMGRIVNDVAHIIDIYMILTDATPISVCVDALSAYNSSIFPTDNMSATIKFSDGSICTIVVTNLGHSTMGNERLELCVEGKSIVMEDYLSLAGWGFPKSFSETAYIKDLGHRTLVKQFIERIAHKPYLPVIPIKRLLQVMQTTLIIDQLACEGGGEKNISTE